MDGGCWCSAGVKGRNYDRVCNSQVALERQGMDEEKATKCDKIAKNTFSTFQSCAFAFKDLMKNSCKLRTRLFQSKLFSSSRKFNFQSFKTKMCFFAFYRYYNSNEYDK